jgi:phosphoribosylanthranilate isomerase
MPLRWKVCGLTTERDAVAAVAAGADAVGFVFYPPSPRAVSPKRAGEISSVLPAETWRFGVFVDAPAAAIEDTIAAASLDFAQLSGDEDPATTTGLSRHAFKALRLEPAATAADAAAMAARYPECTLLVDTHVAGEYGGTGVAANWGAARSLASEHRLMLAGGLTPENVATAVETVRPWAVDVSSGVESGPGRKCPELLRRFAAALEAFR